MSGYQGVRDGAIGLVIRGYSLYNRKRAIETRIYPLFY